MNKDNLTLKQKQTKETFSYKWKRRDSYESDAYHENLKDWLMEKYFNNKKENIESLFKKNKKTKFLDAGCGSGVSACLLFERYFEYIEYTGVDITDAVEIAKERFNERSLKGNFVQADLLDIPSNLGNFDIIFSEGVLHHTDSVKNAICSLSKRLNKAGKFIFYIYAKKAPIREFTDDYIREKISLMDEDSAWNCLKPLTLLGKTLGELKINIEIKEDIPLIGVQKGEYDLQRFIYYKIMKCFYKENLNLEEMNHINYDWFMPKNCYRHTPDEVVAFCEEANLKIQNMHVEEAGITVIASK